MRYAQIRSMDISNGEGVGVSLFVQGCPFHCKNCFNKEAWDYNYGEVFTEKEEEDILEFLDNDFIISVTKFISDLRNIKQIFNDYQLLLGNFEFLFDDSKSIAKNIFSISILKNYYPSDYNQLLSNNGKLYELMNRQGEYLSFVEANKKFFNIFTDPLEVYFSSRGPHAGELTSPAEEGRYALKRPSADTSASPLRP